MPQRVNRGVMIASVAMLAVLSVAGRTDPTVVFHRGTTTAMPENTLGALEWAVRAGAQVIEIDVRVTADGHPVVMHDANVARTTNGRGQLRRMSLESLKALDAGAGQRVPTLDEALEFARPRTVRLLLDVKEPERLDARDLLARLDRHDMRRRTIVGGSSPSLLRELRRLDPKLELLAFVPNRADIDDYLALDVDVVRLWARWIDRSPGLVGELQASGAEVWVTTRRLEGERLDALLAAGVDGVITDQPLETMALEAGTHSITTD